MMEDLHQEIPSGQSPNCNIPLGERGGPRRIASAEMRKEVGARLRKIRQAMGLSQTEMADLLKIRRQALGVIENGQHLPDVLNLLPLCQRYGVTLEYIYYNNPRLLPEWLIKKFPEYKI